jgi:hypothetical protein
VLNIHFLKEKNRPKVEKNPKICYVSTHGSSKQASSQDIKGF